MRTPICRYAAGALLGSVLLAGCGSTAPAPSEPIDQRPLATPATTTTAAGPTKSPRGLIPKQVGEIAGFTGRDTGSDLVVRFAITKITVDPKCEGDAASVYAKPENGHFIRVDMTIETDAGYRHDDELFRPSQTAWSIQGPDGFTESGSTIGTFAAFSCASESLPDTLNPSSKYTTVITLDSKNTSGVLMFQPYAAAGESGGWEWTF